MLDVILTSKRSPAAVKRNLGRSQLAGNNAPAVVGVESGGSRTHTAPGGKRSAAPKRSGGCGETPGSKIGSSGKSLQCAVQRGTGVSPAGGANATTSWATGRARWSMDDRAEVVRLEAYAAVPDLESGEDVAEVPAGVDHASADAVVDEALQVEADGGDRVGPNVRDDRVPQLRSD